MAAQELVDRFWRLLDDRISAHFSFWIVKRQASFIDSIIIGMI